MARILVAEDQPHMSYLLWLLLTKRGHQVTRAADGCAALELLRSQSFDLLITDVEMPHMNGLTLITHRDVIDPLDGVIVITARCDFAKIKDANCCANVHVAPKPFSPSTLLRLVEELVSGRRKSTCT